jgi:hypothetical protein
VGGIKMGVVTFDMMLVELVEFDAASMFCMGVVMIRSKREEMNVEGGNRRSWVFTS